MGVDRSAIHPATLKRERIEADLKVRINKFAGAVLLRRTGKATQDYVERCEDEMLQGLQLLKDACYDEMDDGHGLGKEGLDAARELVEDAVWYPLEQLSAGGRRKEAWLVSDERFRALADAIKVDTP